MVSELYMTRNEGMIVWLGGDGIDDGFNSTLMNVYFGTEFIQQACGLKWKD